MAENKPSRTSWVLVGILLLAAGLRLGGLFHDLPFSYYGDELHLMKRSMALGTGDLNPHWFNKPAFLMYLLLGAYGFYFVFGWSLGRFESVDEFAAHFLTDSGPFLLIGRSVVCLFGVALVLMVYLLGKRGLKSDRAGLIGALLAAVLPTLVVASQTIKADAPCAFFLAASVYVYLRAKNENGLKPLVLSALLAGAAMGTKYCGVILLPAYLVWETGFGLRGWRTWKATLIRQVTILACFVLGFFVTSPYNFLDPTWAKAQWERSQVTLGATDQARAFDPDSKVVYETGAASWPKATAHFLVEMRQPYLGGLWILLPISIGLILGLGSSSTRPYSLFVLAVFAVFMTFAVVLFPFHVSARHFSNLTPFLAPLFGLGVVGVAQRVQVPRLWKDLVPILLAFFLCLPSTVLTLRHNRYAMRLDSRSVARDWIVESLSTARILVEDEGPALNPSLPALERMQADLAQLETGPFTRHQQRRLDLLSRYPAADGLDIDRLGHPWWVGYEVSAKDLRESPYHTRVGNPLVQRIPLTLEEYRQAGIEVIITNSQAQRLIASRPDSGQSFPSFIRLYRELETARLLKEFDPETWDGKGPKVWIYDIREES